MKTAGTGKLDSNEKVDYKCCFLVCVIRLMSFQKSGYSCSGNISLLEESKSHFKKNNPQKDHFHVENGQQGRGGAGGTSTQFYGQRLITSRMRDNAGHSRHIVLLPVASAPDSHSAIAV